MKKLTILAVTAMAFCNMANAQWSISGNNLSSTTGTTYIENQGNDNMEFKINGSTVGTWLPNYLSVAVNLDVSGSSYVQGSFYVNGHSYINQDEHVTGNCYFNQNVNCNQNIDVQQDAHIQQNAYIQQNLEVAMGTVGIGTAAPTSTFVIDINGAGRITSGTWSASDARFKKNITPITDVKDKLFKVTSTSYDFKKDEFKEQRFDDKNHFGFIAQELEKIYPNLVQKDEKGYYTVNYTEFIPLLLQALKEEDTKVKALENRIAALERGAGSTGINNQTGNSTNTLAQNIPNPFNGSTVIKFSITTAFERAFIGVYDMNGKQVRQVSVLPGMSQVSFEKDQLTAGMYMYSLVVDDNLVDTKRMVISD